uniref:protein-tyrosine-phosphatase n=1 Tax=Amphiprion ocellaris TaxID=80972 RepID=A0A3Q1ASY7_AMPOC
MKRLSYKTNSDHLLLCVFLSLLWGATDSTTISSSSTEPTTAITSAQPTTKPPPDNVGEVKVVNQNETSITLKWDKVKDISVYILQYDENGKPRVENIGAPPLDASVEYEVYPLTAGTKYNFTLITVFEGVNSTGYNFTAVTAPRNAEDFKTVGQNETSITLQWKQVNNIDRYILVVNEEEITVTSSEEFVTHTVSGLTSGTRYKFRLFTVFENVTSSGVNHTAVTAPDNVGEVKVVNQNETSITLKWDKVKDISVYILQYDENGKPRVENIGAPPLDASVEYEVYPLTAGTKYNFTLITVFEGVNSTGYNFTAVTAPRNAEDFKTVGQNETSITLQWKQVNNIDRYILVVNEEEITVTSSEEFVTHTVSGLTSGTRYEFRLFTVFENVTSSGVNHTAVTAPDNVGEVKVVNQNETSITLKWDKVKDISVYILQYDENGKPRVENIDALPLDASVEYEVYPLTAGTKYNFTLITVFEGVNSTGYNFTAVTAIDCASVEWHVTTSSIQGTVEGLFTIATATYNSQTLDSSGSRDVSFTGLVSGATYELSLKYEILRDPLQCRHNITVFPSPPSSAHCEYYAAGYSAYVFWNKPDGVWTTVEVNVIGKYYEVDDSEEQNIIIQGLQPARSYQVSLNSVSGHERRSNSIVFQCSTDPRGVIAGSVIAVLLFCVLVCLAVFIFLKRPDIISRKKSFISGSKRTKRKGKLITATQFADHFNKLNVDDNRGFSEEYEDLAPIGTNQTQKAADLPDNQVRNRFKNVLPYDWCRVKLSTSNGTSDYINASYMPGYNSNREYIASQGPLPSTVSDFWRMIWEQRVKGIVMVTNCTEGGKIKCERYWPADSKPCLYGELLVTIRSEEQNLNWTMREFSVKHRNTSEERSVKHFHFTAWPDHGVPEGSEILIQFRGLVRRHIEKEGARAPTVVHCSAGVGRTGTIIALDVLLQQLEKERAVGIKEFVHKMRLNRPHMVQTESQYVFLHQCIMDALHSNQKPEENIYENADLIYENATALRELR